MSELHSIEGACRLSDRGVIRARGADAAKFLQGQLTNDVLGLEPDAARLAGFCSAKGRLQASFIVWREGADDYLLVCSLDLLAPTLKRLAMFVLRAQCKLSDASAEVELFGVAGAAAEALSLDAPPWSVRDATGVKVIRLPVAATVERCIVVAAPGRAAGAIGAAAPLPLAAWRWLEVQSGIVSIEAATVDRFVPQMVNFELVGGVDFKKGCYPGQEVVARSQYRGTTKRRALLFDCDALPAPGQDVYAEHAPGEPAGTIAIAAPQPRREGSSALVEVRLAALAAGALRLGSTEGPLLHRRELPYALPLDTEPAL